MGLSRNKVAVSEGAAGSPPFYGERTEGQTTLLCKRLRLTRLETKWNIVQYSRTEKKELERRVSVINAEGPPVPIPNTEVKLCSGENTLRATVREDSSTLTRQFGAGNCSKLNEKLKMENGK